MEKGEERSVTLRISGNVAAGTVAGTAGTGVGKNRVCATRTKRND